ncbi:hypothetical protein QQ054_15435 [Oscillatoria amoena NRMC-F 0135]|nr:hypothetical protein [Geitlerinema splendidum]MDL5047410.1 hypothetical protein [Oscillatoria amoena NRMC-F 0135]
MKYFFLSDGWTVGRVWEFGGLWNKAAWRREPKIEQLNVGLVEQGEKLWLYRVEDAVLMVEVKPQATSTDVQTHTIGQVVLKRLISAEQALERLCAAESIFKLDRLQQLELTQNP